MAIPAPAASSDVNRLVRELRSEPRWANVDVRGRPLRTHLDRQPLFTFEGSGSWADKRIVPQTAAGANLLTGRDGAQWEQLIRGVLNLSEARDGVDHLGGISFSTSKPGFAVTQTVGSMATWNPLPADGVRNVSDYFRNPGELRDTLRAASKRNAAATNGGVIAVGPRLSRAITWAMRGEDRANPDGTPRTARDWGTYASKVLAHEVEHSVTAPTDASYNSPLAWVEEAAAETMTEWPGQIKQAGDTFGLPHNGRYADGMKSYRKAVDGMRSLLRLAGVDTRRKDNFQQADQLLQGGKLERTPGRLAKAIVAHNKLPGEAYEPVRTAIRDAAWTGDDIDESLIPGNIRNVERMVASYRPESRP